MMGSGFNLDLSGLTNGLEQLIPRSEAALRMYAETAALKLESYMRDNATWTDRTGDARKRLSSSVLRVTGGYQITLAHGVEYGKWLELANEKRYAIIQPTILVNSDEIMGGLDRLLERLM